MINEINTYNEDLKKDFKNSGLSTKIEFLKKAGLTKTNIITSCALYLFITDEEPSKLQRIKEVITAYENPIIALQTINTIIEE